MAVNVLDGPVIAVGASVSSVVDVSSGPTGITRIICPDEWTSGPEYGVEAPITFLWSPDGTNFYNLYDMKTGKEIQIQFEPGVLYALPRDIWNSGYIKFRSGTARAPVAQQQERKFRCVIE